METMNRRMRFASNKKEEKEEEITLESLAKQLDEIKEQLNDEIKEDELDENLPEELNEDDVAAIQEASNEREGAAQVLADAEEVLNACDKIENASAELPDEKNIVSEEDEVLDACDKLEAQINAFESNACEGCDKTAGIKINDTANGSDPSVSTLADTQIDCDDEKDVFGNDDYNYVASITRKLDRVATALEKRGMNRMAFRIDQLSDRLEASVRK